MPDSESSETNLMIITRRNRFTLFCKLYWRSLIILLTPIILMPIAFVSNNKAYKCFYAFLVSAMYWITDVMHPSIAALVPIALSSIMGDKGFIGEIYIINELLDCIGVMLIIVAIDQSQISKRLALKWLLTFGCSHYRLSFLLFFMTMFFSMWISGILMCGLMLPFVKAILIELERLGIMDMYKSVRKTKRGTYRQEGDLRPTDFTIFYFLGIAYSSSIGSMATLIGSHTNQILKIYCETIFPDGPKIEFPHFMLLNLPGVLVLETFLYFWMNFYFLGMCRSQSDMSLEIGMTEEEGVYIRTLLSTQYSQLEAISFHEGIVTTLVIITALLQATMSSAHIDKNFIEHFHTPVRVTSPCLMCAVLLFILPRELSFLKFFRKQTEGSQPLPQSPSKACLTWSLVRQNVDWSVFLIVGGSATLFESLRDSQMTDELENFLLICASWPSAALIFVIIVFFKVFTEFAPNSCVAYCLLPNIARLGLRCKINPHYLMMAASLSCSLPFHLVAGSPINAMVVAYAHITPSKMMSAAVGVSIASIVVAWFTVAAWATAVWNDNYREPEWAKINIFNKKPIV